MPSANGLAFPCRKISPRFYLQTRLRFLPGTQGRQLPLKASKRVSGILCFPTHEAVLAHFEAGSHEIRKSPSWVHGFLLHLFPN
jgi:hypothetical protein